jgi:hypothetical protein
MAYADVTYSNLVKQAQEDVWRLIDESTAVQAYTKNVLNAMPVGLTSPIGFPYIIVPLPQVSEQDLTMSQRRIVLTFDVEVWIKKLDNAALVDVVRVLLSSNQATFSTSYSLFKFLHSGRVNYVDFPDGQRVQQYIISVQYEWIGVP